MAARTRARTGSGGRGRRRRRIRPLPAPTERGPSLLAGERLAPRPRQQRSLQNRARLKTAALRLFAERGYESASIDDIAARANLAVGGFYLHFRSKRQLLLVLMDDLIQRLSALDLEIERSGDARLALRALLSRAFSSDLEFLGAYRAWQEAVLTDRDLTEKHREIHAWTAQRVLGVLRALQSFAHARPGVDVERLAPVIDTFFWALLAQALRVPAAKVDEWLDASTDLIFHALFLDSHPGGRRS